MVVLEKMHITKNAAGQYEVSFFLSGYKYFTAILPAVDMVTRDKLLECLYDTSRVLNGATDALKNEEAISNLERDGIIKSQS